MAYLGNIPQPTDQLSYSQPQILANFTAIGTMLDPDHGYINLPAQAADPALSVTGLGLYSKNVAAAPIPAIAMPPVGEPDLYISRNTTPGNSIQVPITLCSPNNPGFAYLPSGMIMKWGTATATANANFSTAYAAGNYIPIFNTVLTMQLTLRNNIANNATINVMSALSDALQLTVYLNNPAGANLDFYYLVIGY